MADDEAAEPSLKDKREAFVLAYLGSCRFNATAAARDAGYEFPEVEGCRLLKNARVRARIDQFLDANTLTAKEVLGELAEIARAPWQDFLTVKHDDEGRPIDARLDLGQKIRALELVGKAHKLFTDNTTISNSDGSPLGFTVNVGTRTDGPP